jgi:hypothetical protein
LVLAWYRVTLGTVPAGSELSTQQQRVVDRKHLEDPVADLRSPAMAADEQAVSSMTESFGQAFGELMADVGRRVDVDDEHARGDLYRS